MGLDTTHDCFHGAYSAFMRWRSILHVVLDPSAFIREIWKEGERWTDSDSLNRAWNEGRYEDQSVPINVLMNHSDCDGSIAAEACGPLADALEALYDRIGSDEWAHERTANFVAGLRLAAAAGEDVEFH